MEVIVKVGEREERVRVRRLGAGGAGHPENAGTHEVIVGERTYTVDAAAIQAGGQVWSLRLEGSHHEVAVHGRGHGAYDVVADGHTSAVSVLDPLEHLAQQTAGARVGHRQRRVTAYMPGRVVAVLAAAGDAVAAGQGIVVLEAMKMQNEIQAEQDGVVKDVFVVPGQAVEGGDPLFELE